MNNHLSVYEFDTLRVKLVIVAHGAGLKFFLDDLSGTPWANDKIDPELYKRFIGLTKFGVEAYLCEITYKRQNIDLGQDQEGRVPEVRAVGRRDRGRTAGQGLRLSEGWLAGHEGDRHSRIRQTRMSSIWRTFRSRRSRREKSPSRFGPRP